MRVSLIVAMSQNRVIGKDNAIPWRISADMKHFKKTTMGKVIVMGRKTFESLGKPLPGRFNIVLSRDESYGPDGVEVFRDFADVVASDFSAHPEVKDDEVMVIGGAEIYRLALPCATRIYLTEVHGTVEGDTYFPDWDRDSWREVSRTLVPRDDKATHDCSFVLLERIHKKCTRFLGSNARPITNPERVV